MFMRCRCSDITKIEHDLGVLRQMSNQLSALSDANTKQSTALNSLAATLSSTATPDNMSALTSDVRQANSKVADWRGSMSQKVSTETTSLQNKLTTYRLEDKKYHGAQSSGS